MIAGESQGVDIDTLILDAGFAQDEAAFVRQVLKSKYELYKTRILKD